MNDTTETRSINEHINEHINEQINERESVLGKSMRANTDTPIHTRGESVFLDDIKLPGDVLYAAVYTSPEAHGEIRRLDTAEVKKCPGIAGVFTWEDVPGKNQLGWMVQDEPLLAEKHVAFIGEPIAMAVGKTKKLAKKALKKLEVEIDPLPPITDPRDAFKKNRLIVPPRTFALGDTGKTWDRCDVIVHGRADSGGQEHFYLETQGAAAIRTENGGIKVYSSTQSPTAVQRTVARVLDLPMHKVEVDVRRLGGGFGGKEDQGNAWASLAAVAAYRLNRPVKLVLDRADDMVMTGKRHPYSSDYKMGLSADGAILAYEVTYYQNSGAAADLSIAILERTLFHSTNSYYIPNVKATAACCYTNLTPFTAFRGFGGPQAMFVLECAIHKAAEVLGLPARSIQEKNLLKENDTFPYGMVTENCYARRCWHDAAQRYDFDRIYRDVEAFNASNRLFKKGVAVMPVCFGISFTNTMMNQAGSLVHVYSDGSVSVSTAAVEMGQGVNMKILGIVARTFSISPDRVKVETTNTTRVANTSPTAASSGADLNGRAAQLAAQQILDRLKHTAAELLGFPEIENIEIRDEQVYTDGEPTELRWKELVNKTFLRRANLSAQGYYATPGIYFDRDKEKGKPFAYHVFGTAITEVTLDCLRGIYTVDAVRLVHDGGKSLNPLIDRGQAEGGLMQGVGWMTMEELTYNKNGKLLTDNTSTYKVPDIKSTPTEMQVHFLEDAENPYAVLSSKAIGEPPFMYGIGTYFAILNAMKAFRPDKEATYDSPITPEKVLTFLYGD